MGLMFSLMATSSRVAPSTAVTPWSVSQAYEQLQPMGSYSGSGNAAKKEIRTAHYLGSRITMDNYSSLCVI